LISKLFKSLVHISDESQYNLILNEIHKMNSQGVDYIKKIPQELWCLVFFQE